MLLMYNLTNIFKSQTKTANIEKANKGYRVYIKPRIT